MLMKIDGIIVYLYILSINFGRFMVLSYNHQYYNPPNKPYYFSSIETFEGFLCLIN